MYNIKIIANSEGAVRVIEDRNTGYWFSQKADADCERCKTDPYIPHFSCMYDGKKIGHSVAHCTANACY